MGIKRKQKNAKSKTELVRFTPNSFNDVVKIVNELKMENVILVDISNVSKEDSFRMMDFISGAMLVMDGKYKKIAPKTYLFSKSKEMLKTIKNIDE